MGPSQFQIEAHGSLGTSHDLAEARLGHTLTSRTGREVASGWRESDVVCFTGGKEVDPRHKKVSVLKFLKALCGRRVDEEHSLSRENHSRF